MNVFFFFVLNAVSSISTFLSESVIIKVHDNVYKEDPIHYGQYWIKDHQKLLSLVTVAVGSSYAFTLVTQISLQGNLVLFDIDNGKKQRGDCNGSFSRTSFTSPKKIYCC